MLGYHHALLHPFVSKDKPETMNEKTPNSVLEVIVSLFYETEY